MISSEIKSLVAENCPNYKVKKVMHMHRYSNLNNNCDNCEEYSNEKCEKGLLNDLWNQIRLN